MMAAAPAPWDANPRRRYRLSPWMTRCGLATLAFALGFALAGRSRDADVPNGVSPPPAEATGSTAQTAGAHPGEVALRSAGGPEPGADAGSKSARSNRVTRKGAFVEMVFEGIPLADAIASLGTATGGRVHGTANLASGMGLVNLHWKGSGLEAAWSALLSPVANAAVACGPRSCDVWIVGVNTSAGNSPGARAVAGDTRAPRPEAAPAKAASPALPVPAPRGPAARRNDGPLEAPSAD